MQTTSLQRGLRFSNDSQLPEEISLPLSEGQSVQVYSAAREKLVGSILFLREGGKLCSSPHSPLPTGIGFHTIYEASLPIGPIPSLGLFAPHPLILALAVYSSSA